MEFKSTIKSAGAALLLSGMLMGPALAQSNGAGNNGNSVTLPGTLHKTHDAWRASDLKGANVYNSKGHQIGTIDDLMITSRGRVPEAIISVGGFIGAGNKLVEVPFTSLKFEQSQNGSSTSVTGNTSNQQDYSIVYPKGTSQSLKNMPSFSYNPNNS